MPATAGPTMKLRLTSDSTADTARPSIRRLTRFGTAPVQPDMNVHAEHVDREGHEQDHRHRRQAQERRQRDERRQAARARRPRRTSAFGGPFDRRARRPAGRTAGRGCVPARRRCPSHSPEPVSSSTSSGIAVSSPRRPAPETPWPASRIRKSRLRLSGTSHPSRLLRGPRPAVSGLVGPAPSAASRRRPRVEDFDDVDGHGGCASVAWDRGLAGTTRTGRQCRGGPESIPSRGIAEPSPGVAPQEGRLGVTTIRR